MQDDSITSEPVARVFDKYLYKEDVKELIAIGTTPKDSARLVKRYLDSWVKQQLILNKARLNLSDQRTFNKIEKQLDDYKTSLIIYAYQQELVKQKLDTVVAYSEITDYYNENVDNLILRDNIIRARYMKIPKGAPDLQKARRWCVSELPEDLVALEEYGHQYAKSFLLRDQEWILFENLRLELGSGVSTELSRFRSGVLIELEDSLNVYLVYVLDLIKKDNPAPVEYEKKKIREIILNRRRSELITKMEVGAYQDGISKNYFELYE